MPIYEYVCEGCRHPFEELVRSSSQEVRCPKCQGRELRKLLSVFASNVKDAGSSPRPSGGGCGRCGDPNGPCGS